MGWSGNVHDVHIFRNSCLFRKPQAGTFFPDQKTRIGEVEMPVVILGDPALLLWLMKLYMGSLDSNKKQFKNRLSKCRMVVEYAFGCLKGRFRGPLTRLHLSKFSIPFVVAACCVLHNLCEKKGGSYLAR